MGMCGMGLGWERVDVSPFWATGLRLELWNYFLIKLLILSETFRRALGAGLGCVWCGLGW